MMEIINPMPDGTCRTIKHNYSFAAINCTTYTGSYGATMVAERLTDDVAQNEKKKIYKVKNREVCFIGKFKKEVTYKMDLPDGTYLIRKLSPLECLRLMGFDDCDYHILNRHGISNTHIYEMTGNSIVVDVLEAIFANLNEQYNLSDGM